MSTGIANIAILLWKLDTFHGIRDLPLKLLASYLQGRQQYTAVGDIDHLCLK